MRREPNHRGASRRARQACHFLYLKGSHCDSEVAVELSQGAEEQRQAWPMKQKAAPKSRSRKVVKPPPAPRPHSEVGREATNLKVPDGS